jgi:uncharacterized membrane-anchored protein YjiN (DUF445 family)
MQRQNQPLDATVSELLVKFHSEIGNMVRSSMMKLNNKELVEQIEESGQRFYHPFEIAPL